ncbi:MAG: hypothetical protein GWN99_10180 [Gemmatimonadetes bacterium]|uniref:Uncharacterized protein n=1 Tax=Candidatus Kutchimonas denitrificans TaxID=3056748 RepID=A0AAE4Z8Y0_9BACT|nr:hypothetical protein [Gemmatimonadota bacterium]NIR74662.1 hypothetical protein [Candidatus Kutchimonas denitrificans]NIS01412.1 hypothetical protein [Gemmatimonadota bacterium]NIT67153.1 hypothetical protein [Gemmatimonadota bacterium]NIU52327.1 hypothetical protein [Gemmatimonadota bacterium]
MGSFKSISAVVRTSPERFSGTFGKPWILVNQGGIDRLQCSLLGPGAVGSFHRGQTLYCYRNFRPEERVEILDDLVGPEDLYIRLGTTSSDMWRPELILVWGWSREKGTVPLALDLGTQLKLSADKKEGVVSTQVRRVQPGDREMAIRELLLVAVTYNAPYSGTDDPIWLRVTVGGDLAANHVITDTPQTDLEINSSNVYRIPVERPFTRAELEAEESEVRLGIQGSDMWVPKKIFLFGLDAAEEPPSRVVSLVRVYDPGPLSISPTEGVSALSLPLDAP